jgi:tetratricopeptide (TPR) repeat protein
VAYRRAIAIDPDLPGIYLNLGLAWFKLEKFHEALSAFEKEKATAPSDRVTLLIGMSHFGLGEYKTAADQLRLVAVKQPNNAELSYLLAKCYLWSGQYGEAKEVFRRLIERDPNSAPVHMLLGEALDADHRTPEATAEFEAAVKVGPAQPEAHFGLGFLYWKLKRYEDAEREFREELKRDPKNAQATAYLGDTLMKVGRKQDALKLFQSARELRPDMRIAHFDLAILHAGDKQYDAAVEEYRRAIQIDPSSYDAHYRLGRLYNQLGRSAEAEKEFKIVQALEQNRHEELLMKISGPSQ